MARATCETIELLAKTAFGGSYDRIFQEKAEQRALCPVDDFDGEDRSSYGPSFGLDDFDC